MTASRPVMAQAHATALCDRPCTSKLQPPHTGVLGYSLQARYSGNASDGRQRKPAAQCTSSVQ
jgi:hypothetical protein